MSRSFRNNNAHVIFDPLVLLDINRALAEFYGECLSPRKRAPEAPALDRSVEGSGAFYPAPAKVIDEVLRAAAGIEGRAGGLRRKPTCAASSRHAAMGASWMRSAPWGTR